MAFWKLHQKRRILHRKKIMKKLVKLCLHSSYLAQNSFQFDEFCPDFFWFSLTRKNMKKTRQTLFTFKLHSTELLSFSQFFCDRKFQISQIPNLELRLIKKTFAFYRYRQPRPWWHAEATVSFLTWLEVQFLLFRTIIWIPLLAA